MAKIKGEMNLLVQKIQMKDIGDWGSVELDELEPGLYLCENPDGGMFLMTVAGGNGCRYGLWLPIAEIGNIYVKAVEEKISEKFELMLDSRLSPIANTTNDSYCILNDLDDNLNAKLAMLEGGLNAIRKQIDELPKQSQQQKSTLTELSEAVVSIIKASK